jgi:UDP-N-acetylglucosamine acyltransferase
MAPRIHPTALVDARAEIDETAEIGPYCVVGAGAMIGAGTRLASHVVVDGPAVIGQRNVVHPFAVLGAAPQHKRHQGGPTRLVVGDDNVVREHVTMHRGTDAPTTVGSCNLFMVGCHVAHDATVGSHVTIANGVQLAGHAVVEDHATFGGLSGVAQFVRVGESAFVAAGAMVERDVPPFVIAQGDRARVRALNKVGLRRRGVPEASIAALEAAFRAIFAGKRPQREAARDVKGDDPLVARFVAAVLAGLVACFVAGCARPPTVTAALRGEHRATVAARIDERGLMAEGVAFDPVARVFYVGSIHSRKIVAVPADGGGAARDLVPAGAGLDAVLGLRVDAERRVLWAATTADEAMSGFSEKDRGRSALVKIDLATGAVVARFPAPPLAAAGAKLHMMNDVALDAAGTPYASDSEGGDVLVLHDGALVPLFGAARFPYPNGLAFDDRGALFVAHDRGIARVDVAKRTSVDLVEPAGYSLRGIDGLYFDEGRLIAVQNGVPPHRVVVLDLNEARTAATTARVVESAHPEFDIPTTGALVGDSLVVIADSELDQRPPTRPTLLLRVPLGL